METNAVTILETLRLQRSPIPYARFGGFLYLIIIVLGIFSELFIRQRLLVSGDPAATASRIAEAEELWRLGIGAGILMLVCAIGLAVILYHLLRPVNRYVALLAVLFNAVSIAIEGVIKLELVRVLYLLGNGTYLKAWPEPERFAEAYQAIILYGAGYNISLIFFGFNCLCWGYLLIRSSYFPGWIGVLLIICSLCYIFNSFSWLLAPMFARHLFPFILVPCFIAELSFCLWLLIKGLHLAEWQRNMGLRE